MNAVVSKIDMSTVVADETYVSPAVLPDELGFVSQRRALTLHRFDDLDTLLLSKLEPGFDGDSIEGLSLLLEHISTDRLRGLKYLVYDFAHRSDCEPAAADGFDDLASANARLILDAPVISIAWARSYLKGVDLDFALSCSMIVADRDARFCFEADLTSAVGVYGALAQKLGFMKAERLMENGEVLTAVQMQELGLVKHIVESDQGVGGAASYVRQCGRRHNASYSMFRAQRITAPPVRRQSAAASASRRV
ncbi:enoyl-CoA hydratase-related protein [Methylosinus sp. Sm6]|uniref:enoyl-CoA hydratase-related protein n=1 Tax=Methylosinus sp. Sm6 TaxID=2866948 RepID=UPI001C990062|nr:enoyl-CoA hydratase-related protein [Methylosinus sp. Sm6]MBY6239646.1 enoyl-CoA hydratase [Methylosinus sp. Sm6]